MAGWIFGHFSPGKSSLAAVGPGRANRISLLSYRVAFQAKICAIAEVGLRLCSKLQILKTINQRHGDAGLIPFRSCMAIWLLRENGLHRL